MTSEYDELLALLENPAVVMTTNLNERKEAAAAIRALTAQVVERDAVIEQAPHEEGCSFYQCSVPEWCQPCDCFKSQAPRDALSARDAVRDKTVRATVLREAAEYGSNGTWPERVYDWLRARADQEEQ